MPLSQETGLGAPPEVAQLVVHPPLKRTVGGSRPPLGAKPRYGRQSSSNLSVEGSTPSLGSK
jgi:hypothetical protein